MKAPKCHFCHTSPMQPFVDLGFTPPANSLPERADTVEESLPLKVFVCPRCRLVQLPPVKAAKEIFNDSYVYVSSHSPSHVLHAKQYTDMICKRLGLGANSFVIEVGSNDGYMLHWFQTKGIECLGIEPVGPIADIAITRGIPTKKEFFNELTATQVPQADLICGINVLAHQPDVIPFAKAMAIALKPTGVITMEFPHLMQLVANNQFDTIYHEHYFYFSLHTIRSIFSLAGLSIFDVDEIPGHGGSLRIYAQHMETGIYEKSPRVNALLITEETMGMMTDEYYKGFREKVTNLRWNIKETIRGLNEKVSGYGVKYPVVAYGAAAKASTLFNACGLTASDVKYIVDRSPYKQGKFLPGSKIPIVPEETLRETKPGFVVITAWNYRDEIMQQLDYIREWGGHFIIPIPEMESV